MTKEKEIEEKIYYLKDNDSLSLTGKQLREWKGMILKENNISNQEVYWFLIGVGVGLCFLLGYLLLK